MKIKDYLRKVEILNGDFELNEQYYIKTSSVIFSIE